MVRQRIQLYSVILLDVVPAGDYSAGTTALSTVAEEIGKYVPVMVKVYNAIAGVVAVIGAISVYIAMSATVMVA